MVQDFGLGGINKFGTLVANGNNTTYNIPHGLGETPDYAMVVPASLHAAALFYISKDSTNIVVNYVATTTSGTNNISLSWIAGMKYSVRDEVFAVTRDRESY